ncbi:hypothetical protein VTO73DRAFT_10023 [Trametes versicolor]
MASGIASMLASIQSLNPVPVAQAWCRRRENMHGTLTGTLSPALEPGAATHCDVYARHTSGASDTRRYSGCAVQHLGRAFELQSRARSTASEPSET